MCRQRALLPKYMHESLLLAVEVFENKPNALYYPVIYARYEEMARIILRLEVFHI